MHAASLSAVEAAAATSTAAARVARAETEPTGTPVAVTEQRAETVERDAKEHARLVDEMEKGAVAAEEKIKALGNDAGVSARAVEEKKRQQAVRLVSVDQDAYAEVSGVCTLWRLSANTSRVSIFERNDRCGIDSMRSAV